MTRPQLDVRYTAQLARLDLSEEEIQTFQSQLAEVIGYVNQLAEVDVEGIDPSPFAGAAINVVRHDEPQPGLPVAKALANAPQKANDLIIVTRVIE